MADLQMYADHFLKEMVDEAILGVAYEAHRSFTRGTLFLDEDTTNDDSKYKIVVENGCDVFGQPVSGSKKTVECPCPSCHRHMAASRFAPHLEKCMGMGRNSSRIASQRIANSGKCSASVNDGLGPDDEPDDANDVDWMASETSSSRKTKKRKTERTNGSPRTSKAPLSRSKHSNNSPRTGQLAESKDLDSNATLHGLAARQLADSARSDSGHDRASLWQQHISTTLAAGQEGTLVSPTSQSAVSGSAVPKKPKKSSKHGQSKKSKKRQGTSSQQPLPL